MNYDALHKMYAALSVEGAVGSVSDFCREWLGVERSYMAVLAAKKRNPSVKVLMTCTKRLKTIGNALASSSYPSVSKRGRTLLALANECEVETWRAID